MPKGIYSGVYTKGLAASVGVEHHHLQQGGLGEEDLRAMERNQWEKSTSETTYFRISYPCHLMRLKYTLYASDSVVQKDTEGRSSQMVKSARTVAMLPLD